MLAQSGIKFNVSRDGLRIRLQAAKPMSHTHPSPLNLNQLPRNVFTGTENEKGEEATFLVMKVHQEQHLEPAAALGSKQTPALPLLLSCRRAGLGRNHRRGTQVPQTQQSVQIPAMGPSSSPHLSLPPL